MHTARSLPAPQTVAPELPLRHRSTKQRVRKQSRKGHAHLLTVFLPRGLFCLGGFPREQLLHWPLILSNSTLRACIHTYDRHPHDAARADYRVSAECTLKTHKVRVSTVSQSPNMNSKAEHAAGRSLHETRMCTGVVL